MDSSNAPINLSQHEPFSSGGNRDCYVHPDNPQRCLKVLRKVRSPAERRKEKRFPTNLRPLSFFDENQTEFDTLNYIFKTYPERIHKYLTRNYGFTKTDLGTAIETDLIRNDDQLISLTLEQEIWENGFDATLKGAVDEFLNDWKLGSPTTRAFLPHNLLMQRTNGTLRIKIIDGLGRNSPWIRTLEKLPCYNRFEMRKSDLFSRIRRITDQIENGHKPTHRVSNLKRQK
jgi:hypothetical protein